jgi:hypothetical protein
MNMIYALVPKGGFREVSVLAIKDACGKLENPWSTPKADLQGSCDRRTSTDWAIAPIAIAHLPSKNGYFSSVNARHDLNRRIGSYLLLNGADGHLKTSTSLLVLVPFPLGTMMPSDSFHPLQLKGEVMDLEFTIDTDHRSVAPCCAQRPLIDLTCRLIYRFLPSTPDVDQK